MNVVAIAALGLLFAMAVFGLGLYSLYRQRTAWAEAGQQLGLDTTVPSVGEYGSMQGQLEGVPLHIAGELRKRGRNQSIVTVYRSQIDGWPDSLSIEREGMWADLAAAAGLGDQKVGDPEFDAVAHISGAGALATLTYDRRVEVARALAAGAIIQQGWLVHEHRGRSSDAREIVGRARRHVDRTRRLRVTPGGLEHNATDRRNPTETRLEALEAMAPVRQRELAATLVDDPEPAVALTACRLAGQLPSPQVMRIGLGERPLDVLHIALRHPESLTETDVQPLVNHGDRAVEMAAITWIERNGTVASVAALKQRAAKGLAGPVKQAARAAILALQGNVDAEHGALSVMDGGQGELSVAEEMGALSDAQPTGQPEDVERQRRRPPQKKPTSH